MSAADAPPSRTRIDTAGDTLRRQRQGEPVDVRRVLDAYVVLDRFRQQWAERPWPLTAVNMGLRSMVRTLRLRGEVSQRLKRANRIVDKLCRLRTMRLSQMEDVGGCRVVVEGRAEVDRLRERIRLQWRTDVIAETDYVARPKRDGYRAVHILVRRHGLVVEVQLRTRRQHVWATTVERLESSRGRRVRETAGDQETVAALQGTAALMDQLDRGETAAPETVARVEAWLRSLRSRA